LAECRIGSGAGTIFHEGGGKHKKTNNYYNIFICDLNENLSKYFIILM